MGESAFDFDDGVDFVASGDDTSGGGPDSADPDSDSDGEPARPPIETLDIMRTMKQDRLNQEHMSDPTAQKAARALLEDFYEVHKDDLDLSKKFVGIKNDSDQPYATVAAGVADGAEYIRWNLENLPNGQTYINERFEADMKELAKDTNRLREATLAGKINLNIKIRNRETMAAKAQNTLVRELLALQNANVSTHDGLHYPVDLLLIDGNGEVHGNGRDYHYNEKTKKGNPDNSINLLVQLANGDASIMYTSAHDEMRSTKGYTVAPEGESGRLHPATSFYQHSKDGFLEDGTTPLPKDQYSTKGLRRDELTIQQMPLLVDETNKVNTTPAAPFVQGGNGYRSALDAPDTQLKDHRILVLEGTLAHLKRTKDGLERNLNSSRRSDDKKGEDRARLAEITTEITAAQRELGDITSN